MENRKEDDSSKMKDFSFKNLVDLMEKLRSPSGCPWDREQTHASIKQHIIEEAYEVLETIEDKDDSKFVEELGDLLLQILFHAQIAKERGAFGINDVIDSLCRKIITRHIHVFGGASAENPSQALNHWESVKRSEKGHTSYTQSLKDIPPQLPALMRSLKVQKKVSQIGFDWKTVEDAMPKVHEELKELEIAMADQKSESINEEVGDLLFAVVNIARLLKIEPEIALNSTTRKFIKRFEYIEKMSDKPLEQMTLQEMDLLWDKAKMVLQTTE